MHRVCRDRSFLVNVAACAVVSGAALALGQCVTFAPPMTTPVTGPVDLAVGDFNFDGRADVAVTGSTGVTVLLGNGDGTFQPGITYPAGVVPAGIVAGDFDLDGRLDLAVADTASNSTVIWVLRNSGNGTFQAAVSYSAGPAPICIAAGDFNGDDRLDLAAGDADPFGGPNGGQYAVLRNTTANTFVPMGGNVTGPGINAIVTGLFINNDANRDIAVAVSAGVRLVAGNGNATFQIPGPPLVVGGQPVALTVGDFNNDGHQDIASANLGGAGTVSSIVWNGSFYAVTNYSVQGYSVPICIDNADVTGDGKLDLLVGSSSSSVVLVYEGTGTGSFLSPRASTTGNRPRNLKVADFNGDGRPDVVVVNDLNNQITVLLNVVQATIMQNPASCQSLAAGQALVLSVTACGPGPLAYQWRRNGVPLVDGPRAFGATTSSLLLSPTVAGDTGSYDVQVTSGFGGPHTATSSPAAVLITGPDPCTGQAPVLLASPTSRAVVEGETASFSVGVSGPGLSYQWRRNGVNMVPGPAVFGVTSSLLTINPVALADNASAFDCVVTNTCGLVRSDPAALSVSPSCGGADFNGDGDVGTDADIEAFFRVLAGGSC